MSNSNKPKEEFTEYLSSFRWGYSLNNVLYLAIQKLCFELPAFAAGRILDACWYGVLKVINIFKSVDLPTNDHRTGFPYEASTSGPVTASLVNMAKYPGRFLATAAFYITSLLSWPIYPLVDFVYPFSKAELQQNKRLMRRRRQKRTYNPLWYKNDQIVSHTYLALRDYPNRANIFILPDTIMPDPFAGPANPQAMVDMINHAKAALYIPAIAEHSTETQETTDTGETNEGRGETEKIEGTGEIEAPKKLILTSIHVGENHWIGVGILTSDNKPEETELMLYEPLYPPRTMLRRPIVQSVINAVRASFPGFLDENIKLNDAGPQDNAVDCGVLTCAFFEFVAKEHRLPTVHEVTQADAVRIRAFDRDHPVDETTHATLFQTDGHLQFLAALDALYPRESDAAAIESSVEGAANNTPKGVEPVQVEGHVLSAQQIEGQPQTATAPLSEHYTGPLSSSHGSGTTPTNSDKDEAKPDAANTTASRPEGVVEVSPPVIAAPIVV